MDAQSYWKSDVQRSPCLYSTWKSQAVLFVWSQQSDSWSMDWNFFCISPTCLSVCSTQIWKEINCSDAFNDCNFLWFTSWIFPLFPLCFFVRHFYYFPFLFSKFFKGRDWSELAENLFRRCFNSKNMFCRHFNELFNQLFYFCKASMIFWLLKKIWLDVWLNERTKIKIPYFNE